MGDSDMGNRILVVDDDRNIGQILHASFSAKGYEVYIARNGEDALAEFEKNKPDLVVLDVLLPKMNGWEVCKQIKNTPEGSRTPVILMSAIYKTPKMQMEAKQKYNSDDFIEKPFQLSRMVDMVVKFIGEPKVDDAAAEVEIAVEADAAPAAPAAPAVPISLEGEFQSISFPELLHDLYVMGKSGQLSVSSEGKRKDISVMDGYPVSVATNLEDEFFGNYLVRQHLITAPQRDEAVSRMLSSGRLLGTVLIEMEVLNPQQVVNFLRMQVRDKLFEIFSWASGTYRFNEDPHVTGDIQNVEMSVANIINEGVRRHYPYARIDEVVKDYRPKYLHQGSDRRYRFQDLDLTPSESKLMAAINGTKTFEEVLAESTVPVERTLQILYTLIVSGMVEPSITPRAAPQSSFITPDETAPAAEQAEETVIDIDVEEEAEEETAPKARPKSPPEKPAPADKKSAETPPADGEEDTDIRARVLSFYERLSEANLFTLLGVGDNPTEHEVRIAYHKLAKEFHPDRFFGKASGEIKTKVEEIFQVISQAYDLLNTQQKIIAYKNQLAGDVAPDEEQSARIMGVKKIILAEQRFQAGLQFLKEKRFTRAAHALREALEIAQNEPEYIAYYGWALYNIPNEKDPDEEELALRPKESMGDMQFEARESLNRAIAVNPRTEKAYIFLGTIYRDQGLSEFAEKQFEKALICNPNSIDAMRELRLIKLKEIQAKTKKKSIFDKIFKR
jgi:CheY-like chemotaxis protein/curved DNA-binding protein CbpA